MITAASAIEFVVPVGPALADRMRRPHQRTEAMTWIDSCRYRGFEGMQRWVRLGVIADNIIQTGRCFTVQKT